MADAGRRGGSRSRSRCGALAALALAVTACAPAAPAGSPAPAEPGAAARAGAGLPAGVSFHRLTRTWSDGREARISLLRIAPDADARVVGVHGEHLATPDTVRAMAARAGAVAAVNGGFFDVATGPDFSGYAGDPLGVYASDGVLLSEAAQGRTALVLGPRGSAPRVTRLRTAQSVAAADGAVRELDGVDRVPGRILGCGGVGGDVLPATGEVRTAPLHNHLCTDPDEIVRFTPEWGVSSPPGAPGSVEALLGGNGRVTEVRSPAGGPIPRGAGSLYGVGDGAAWLRAHARPGGAVTVASRITDMEGRSVLAEGVSVLGGGPGLVYDGRPAVDLAENGYPASALAHRAPRTLAGVRADGTLLLAVVDGRTPTSAGATFQEAASLMAGLGAVSALNLDGGGSSTMAVDGSVENTPMDGDGRGQVQRPVATAVAVLP
ncbi:phosphodiester glycosidase family protein [Streptomyces poonensis]|uniref:Phosphodiester glycosidase domain-containing protein n=1 Tax=Streptomyces poonensis TaxID=68255 RepID=A0A918PWX8_9ACTN|nr:phosphodiester glycosidase family protein [Streptomyces poonensis]GGZ26152.1 hypothetical protein GCM10010365_53070 [Streptomyces poonensis]GLJ89029.1 hypothetical protein GCM10017589_16290 [Streptomyces poonensis]